MKEYCVTVPIMGAAFVTVQAETEEDAIQQALGVAGPDDVDAWEPLEYVVQGNVCYANPSKAYVESVSELE